MTEANSMHLVRARRTFIFLALIGAFTIGLALRAQPASAQADDVFLAIRVGDSHSEPTSVGAACAEIQVGEEFLVDVHVENVTGLRSFELRVTYDSAVLAVEGADFNHFLLSTTPSGQILPALFESEGSDRYYLGAAEIDGTPDSGSGVLARLTMKAVSEGMGEIGITGAPSVYGPRLSNEVGAPIGDSDEDGIFDGPVYSGAAAVGESCDGSDLEEPQIDSPDDSADNGGTAGGGSAGSDSDSAPGHGGVILDLGSGGTVDDGTGPSSASQGEVVLGPREDPDEDSGTAEVGPREDPDEDSGTAEGPDDSDVAAGEDADEGSSLATIWYVLAAMALLALATLGLAVKSLSAR